MRFIHYLQYNELDQPSNALLEALKSSEEFEDYIERLGDVEKLKTIGGGYYSNVFEHPVYNNVVVKVFRNDTAYRRYMKWVLDNQDNKYVPQVVSYHKYKMGEKRDKVGIVFLKKLKKIKKKQLYDEVAKIAKYSDTLKDYKNRMTFADFDVHDWKDVSKNAKKDDPDLAEFAKWMVKWFKRTTQNDDLHDENVMYDENDHLIFTDPVSED